MTSAGADSFLFDRETQSQEAGNGSWAVQVSDQWNISGNPNGGYLMAVVLRAMATLCPQPDPLTVTAHFCRPGLGGTSGIVRGDVVKLGRTISTVQGGLIQEGKQRLSVLAGFGKLPKAAKVDEPAQRFLTVDRPQLPPPEECVDRAQLSQGVSLPILDNVEVRVPREYDFDGSLGRAATAGWIRFVDRRPPDALSLVLFADAFAPSLFSKYGRVGWVPTLEMTIQVRRQPVQGWVAATFVCDDLVDGTMIETGSLWDQDGNLVARSRQLGLLMEPDAADQPDG